MKTAVTLFSGGGMAALGLRAAGYQIVGAVEYIEAIAACYALNVGPIELADLSRLPARWFARWAGVDLLQVSPPCPNFSNAKTSGYETALDYRLAGAVCRALRVMRPGVFILENVRGYVHSASYARIVATLKVLGYTIHARVLNSADWGVPQTRERIILRAVRNGQVPILLPTHREGGDMFSLPWVGWYAAIEDLISTLPASQFAPWQLARLPFVAWTDGTFLIGGGNTQTTQIDSTARPGSSPAYTISPSSNRDRAFLVDGQNARSEAKGGVSIYAATEPAMTIPANAGKWPTRAFLANRSADKWGDGVRHAVAPMYTVSTHTPERWRAQLDAGRVVQLTPRALARFQTIPDWYILPDKASLACRIIGNAVPVLLIQKLAEQLKDVQT